MIYTEARPQGPTLVGLCPSPKEVAKALETPDSREADPAWLALPPREGA